MVRLRESFLAKMDDDFNTGGAVSDLFEQARCMNRFIEAQNLEDSSKRTPENLAALAQGMAIIRELGAILGLFAKPPKQSGQNEEAAAVVDGLMKLLIELRATSRKNKDFAMADAIRNGLSGLGITIQDLKEGTTWERVKQS
jgi:cysteinyl-tRNA synthetase